MTYDRGSLQRDRSSQSPILAALGAQLQADPDGRLSDHCQRWHERTGQWVSAASLHRARRAFSLDAQKKLTASERDEERAGWRQAHASKLETYLRRLQARTRARLESAIAAVTPLVALLEK